MSLPFNKKLPVNLLAACFNNTSATYKFYWLLAIIENVENGESTLKKQDLFARMISKAWFTINYFQVSFGVQDKIQHAVKSINQTQQIDITAKAEAVYKQIKDSVNPNTNQILRHFNKNVPHWFMSPWFPKMTKPDIYKASKEFNNKCIYALYDDRIVINPEWIDYLIANTRIIKNFCYWNLAIFLQSKNPNVPDIPNKIIKPAIRNNLTKQRRSFWDLVINELGSVRCIYTDNELTIGNYAVEHFIPHAFVSHDLIWNLIPADISFNCKKGDRLPNLDIHYDSFFNLQYTAIKIIKEINPKNKHLEDYLSIFPDLGTSFTRNNFKDRIQPLITIASNNGFEFLK